MPFKFFLVLIFSALFFVHTSYAKYEGELSAGMVNPGHETQPSWFKDSFLDLYEDVEEATEGNKRLLLYYYQDGCPYCKKLLDDNLSQRNISDKMQKHFDVVSMNIWGDKEVTLGDEIYTEKTFAEALKVQYTPTLLFFDENKKIVFRANGYYPPEKFSALLDYVGEKKETKLSYQDYMVSVDPQPSTGRLHTNVNNVVSETDLTQNQNDKPLLIMFEQNACIACDEIHLDILKRKESVEQLSRFNVLVLNMWSSEEITTPTGIKMKISDWAEKLDIKYAPSFVFFNRSGAEVFRSDAYLKAFHTQSIMDYVASGAYKKQSNFQRYIDARADYLREEGFEVNLMD